MLILDDVVVQGIDLDALLKLLEIKKKEGVRSNYYYCLATISFNKLTCLQCGQEIGISLRYDNDNNREKQAIFRPCTRVVLGTDHKITGLFVDTKLYFCLNCISIPEALAKEIPEIKDRLNENPIIHMPKPTIGKGSWITVTEFPMGHNKECGRFLNYQTDSVKFKEILRNTFLRAYLHENIWS